MLLRSRVPARVLRAFKNLLNNPPPFILLPKPPPTSSRSHLSFTDRLIFSSSPSKRVLTIPPFALGSPGLSYTSHARVSRPVPEEYMENRNVNSNANDSSTLKILIGKLKKLGLDASSCKPGEDARLLCPRCKGGDSSEISLSIRINVDGGETVWNCFRAKCGWRGSTKAFADAKLSDGKMNRREVKEKREITEENLELEPLSEQLLAWFSSRMISRETLRRNSVMQRRRNDQIVIAFTYRRDGKLVNCKYRDINKRFSQFVESLD